MSTQKEIAIPCVRCGKMCRPAESNNPNARPFRKAKKGLCENCVVTQFLLCDDLEVLRIGLLRNGIEVLKNPNIQNQFSQILKVGRSELLAENIDWDTVIEQWDLPFPKRSLSVGDSMESVDFQNQSTRAGTRAGT